MGIARPKSAHLNAWFVTAAFVAVAILVTGMFSSCSSEQTVTLFEDITLSSGLSYTGMTHGSAWGDFDGDGLPDLYVTNHLKSAKLYRNLGRGRFEDVTDKFFAAKDLLGDKHGAAWADFDNDGRLDLVQLTGAERGVGSEPKRLLLNQGSRFEDVGQAAGVSNPFGRTRTPLWFDFNRDGRLDLFQGAEARFDDRSPPFIFVQHSGTFESSSEIASFASRSVPFCIVTELTSSTPDLVCRVPQRDRTAQVFSTAQLPMPERDLLPPTAFEDIAAGDFNNDGLIDLYLARKNPAAAVSFGRPGDSDVIADISVNQSNASKSLGFSFRSSGQLDFRVAATFPSGALSPDDIHIGSRGAHPGALAFTLSPEVAYVAGTASYQPGGQTGLYIGLTPPDKWQVLVSAAHASLAGDKSKYQQVAVKVTSSTAITDLGTIGDPAKPEEAPGRLFMNQGGKLVEESEKRGINARLVSAVNAVAGDFNNDMYLDLFVLASGDIGKQENMLLLNRGDGNFDVVAQAGGAGGDRVGVGDSVTMVDFDGDGFLDLLVATGGSMGRSMGLPSEAGSYHLYHNFGNGNHWLEIDLEGTKSNRDGIGARVQVTAGGVTQVRIQDGGVHHRAQNHARLHFGLARNGKADKITIRWPSGTVQELGNVDANRVIRIREP